MPNPKLDAILEEYDKASADQRTAMENSVAGRVAAVRHLWWWHPRRGNRQLQKDAHSLSGTQGGRNLLRFFAQDKRPGILTFVQNIIRRQR